MLQQTTVAAVQPRFERFLAVFPSVANLAAADEADVLKQWEGLGYYRRARHLHQAARLIVSRHDGCLPEDSASWRALPGIGRYMAGAILSQAFEQRLPIVEVNTQRVLCRLFGQRGDPRQGKVRDWLWQQAESILPARKVGEFNQALMELGALVCTPARPKCAACPLARFCTARRLGLQEVIPALRRAKPAADVREVAVIVKRGRSVLLVQRPLNGRWAALWEFPRGVVETGETDRAAAARVVSSLTGLKAQVGAELCSIKHGIMRERVTLTCYDARYRFGRFCSSIYPQGRWVPLDRLHDYPLSSPQRKLASIVEKNRGRRSNC